VGGVKIEHPGPPVSHPEEEEEEEEEEERNA
jgi:hypothetical protein